MRQEASSAPRLLSHAWLSLVTRLQERCQPLRAPSSNRDAQTGLPDRRNFIQAVSREWALARRHRLAGAVVLAELDHFRRINDTFGRRCGDAALCRVAKACGEGLREGDVLAHLGGEEFILYLPHTDPLGALDVAERLRARVAALEFNWHGHAVRLQLSAGVASLRDDQPDLDQLLREADEALFIAKSAGRNCVRASVGRLPGQPRRALRS